MGKDINFEEVDFSERMLELVERIKNDFEDHFDPTQEHYLSPGQVNNLIYKHDIKELHIQLVDYLKKKNSVWVLFDNIDKAWPTRGLDRIDIAIIRSLIDATVKIQYYFQKYNILFYSTIFLRNDVFELLVDETSDRGKLAKASLDWTDADRLKEIIRRRLIYNDFDSNITFQDAWRTIFISHINGEDSSDFLIRRSLMRPRNFLILVNYCKSTAVNLRHHKITDEDVFKACAMYSRDIVNEIGLEIRDVFPQAEDVPYYFIGAPPVLKLGDVKDKFTESPISPSDYTKLIEILLWFGFMGVKIHKGVEVEEIFIYDVYYDMKKLKRLADNLENDEKELIIHCAFWPFLDIIGSCHI